MRRRSRLLIAALCLLLALSGCRWGGTSRPKKARSIAMVVKGTDTEFWQNVNEGAQVAAEQLGVTVTMTGPAVEKNSIEEIRYLRQAAALEPDAIILAASDYSLLAGPVQEVIDSGIPVVMVDSDVNNQNTVAFIGSDNVSLGSMLAGQLCSRMETGGEVGVVSFVRDSYPAIQREEGFIGAMAGDSRFTLLDTVWCDSDANQAEKLTMQLVREHPDMAAVAALNAHAAIGAARALSGLGRSDIRLFVIDCLPEEAVYLEEGYMELALLQNPIQMGYYSVETAWGYLDGEETQDVTTDVSVIDKSTLFEDPYEQLIFPFNS